MHSVFLGVFLAGLALLAAPTSNENLPPVGCLVTHTDRLPHADLMELVKSGFAPKTKSATITMELVSKVVQQCRRTYGWAKPRENAAVQYFSARVLYDDAEEQGQRFGMTTKTIDDYVAGLTPEARTAYATGKTTPELNRAAFAHLKSSGVKLDGLAQADVMAVGKAFNLGVYAAVSRAAAERGYAGK